MVRPQEVSDIALQPGESLTGDVDRGIKDFTTALAYRPNDKGALLLRSGALVEKHEYDLALVDTDRVLTADPKDLAALTTRGQIHSIRRDYAAAETDFDNALIAKPEADLAKPFLWGTGQNLLREALLIADHTSYHVGELIVLRRLLGAWK